MLVITGNRALNDDRLDPDLRREIAAAAKTYDFARLEALSDRCDQDVDNRAKCFHAFLSSRVSGPGDSPFLEDNPEMQRRTRDFAVSSAMAYAIFSRRHAKLGIHDYRDIS